MSLSKVERVFYNKYHPPGGSRLQTVKLNAVFVSGHNTVRHELSKALGGVMLNKWGDVRFTPEIIKGLRVLSDLVEFEFKDWEKNKVNFISEAVPTSDSKRRVDLVKLDDDTRIEFETNGNVKVKDDSLTIFI